MTKQTHEPGPGRSPADGAFAELTKEIAQRNERAQKEARRLRSEREQEQAQASKRHEPDPLNRPPVTTLHDPVEPRSLAMSDSNGVTFDPAKGVSVHPTATLSAQIAIARRARADPASSTKATPATNATTIGH